MEGDPLCTGYISVKEAVMDVCVRSIAKTKQEYGPSYKHWTAPDFQLGPDVSLQLNRDAPDIEWNDMGGFGPNPDIVRLFYNDQVYSLLYILVVTCISI